MATRSEEFFHDQWLGMVQGESDGLVVAKPVLLAANCMDRQPPSTQERLHELCPQEAEGTPRRIANLLDFFEELLDLDADLWESGSSIPDEVSLYAPEGPQTVRPTLGLLCQDESDPGEGAGSPASIAAAKYVALVWDVTAAEGAEGSWNGDAVGLPLDKPETITGDWSYPAAAKFDRLLRHCRVPVGILTNREVIRLVYAPHGESSGHITFRVDDMATVGGRPILDAMVMLLCANQWFGVSDENALPSLLRRSREYQGTVTEDLAEQVFSGLEQLLRGFQTAAERDGSAVLREALERDDNHLYHGLLTVMLRLVFILYAEDRGLLPVDHPHYAQHMSLLGLFERLQRDHGSFPDSMNNRFGAWGYIISLSRAIYLGVEHGDFHIPPRQGDLFDPHRYPFLEGWSGGSAPIVTQTARAKVKVPTIDDGAVYALLRSLLIFQGQRLSYRTLDVEQIGSVYEALMGYQVSVCESPAVAIKISSKRGAAKYWLAPEAVLTRPAGQRMKWLKDECGFDTAAATKISKALEDARKRTVEDENAAIESLLPLAAGKKGLLHEQQATIGQYVLQPGSERRSSGTNYTPRSLTEPIVRRTLEPLITCLGAEPTADQLLALKVCDPAMGSGAFLVECCRQLADGVVAAWERSHEAEGIAAVCPDRDIVAHARRLVAQRCLYGVDKNSMAVPLAKLSLWLFTLARDLPFTFLDHCLRHGDSLVGLELKQVEAFNWKPEKQLSFLELEIKHALDEVVAIRLEIHQLAVDATPEGQKRKAQRHFDANDATEKIRRIADVCVGAFFAAAKEKDRAAARQLRESRVQAWLTGDDEAGRSMEEWAYGIRTQCAPFHWWLEFPEVFARENPGFDAVVGNPPFLGGRLISGAFGDAYLAWLAGLVAVSVGQADLAAHFVESIRNKCRNGGTFGLVTTNSIRQASTARLGLGRAVSRGVVIYYAISTTEWPGDAAVHISKFCGFKGEFQGRKELDGREVQHITESLKPHDPVREKRALQANDGIASKGYDIGGAGFLLDDEEYPDFAKQNPSELRIVRPHINGSELYSRPDLKADRYVINFLDWPLEQAAAFPAALSRVRKLVKPYRDTVKRKSTREKWWIFNENRPGMRSAISGLDRVLVKVLTSNTWAFAFLPASYSFDQALVVFAIETYAGFAALHSRVHEVWARWNPSTMKSDDRYTIASCFKTFPFPKNWMHDSALEAAGKSYDEFRAALMIRENQGMTAIYKRFHDPDEHGRDVLMLRELHDAMDRAMLDAYGWADIATDCEFLLDYQGVDDERGKKRPPWKYRWPDEARDEVLRRLLQLNAEQAAAEEREELYDKSAVESSPAENSKGKTD